MNKISFVIPCYRSEHTITSVIKEIVNKCQERPTLSFEIICVNDCSPDCVWDVLTNIASSDDHVVAINLSRNYGQANAQMAGLNHAQGDVVVCLDDDGQCPVDRLWELIAPLEIGDYDMAIARYPHKKQSLFKNLGSYVNHQTMHALLDLPPKLEDANFFAFTKHVNKNIIKYKNPYPFIIGIVCNITKKIVNVPMEERERTSGTTGYTLKKLLHLWLNGFTSFSVVPLRIADVAGFICAFVGFVFGIVNIIRKLVRSDVLLGYTSVIATLLFVGGMIMILLGLIGEYIGRIFICINNTPQYVIREMVNAKSDE